MAGRESAPSELPGMAPAPTPSGHAPGVVGVADFYSGGKREMFLGLFNSPAAIDYALRGRPG